MSAKPTRSRSASRPSRPVQPRMNSRALSRSADRGAGRQPARTGTRRPWPRGTPVSGGTRPRPACPGGRARPGPGCPAPGTGEAARPPWSASPSWSVLSASWCPTPSSATVRALLARRRSSGRISANRAARARPGRNNAHTPDDFASASAARKACAKLARSAGLRNWPTGTALPRDWTSIRVTPSSSAWFTSSRTQ